MFLQPKVNLSDGRVAGAEAVKLAASVARRSPGRLHPDGREDRPAAAAHALGLDHVLGIWRGWSEQGVKIPIAVNVSPRTLLDQDLPTVVDDLLQRWGVRLGSCGWRSPRTSSSRTPVVRRPS